VLAILIGFYELVNDIRPREVMRPYLQRYTVLVGLRVQLQETVSAGTASRGGGVSCLSSLC